MQDNNNSFNSIQGETDEIIVVLNNLWNSRKLILKVVSVFFTIGFIIALSSPIIYQSETTFVPQISDQSGSAGGKGLSSLASLAGIDLNSEISSSIDNYLSPLLYSRIFESDEFVIELYDEELTLINGKRLTIKDYLVSESSKFNLVSFIKKNTIDLISNLFKENKKNDFITEQFLIDNNFISPIDYNLIKVFKKKFAIELNEKVGYIKVKGYDKDAFISMQIVKLVTKNLQSRIISLRTNKIKEQLDFSKEQYKKKQDEFNALQNNLAKFKDSNKNINTALFLSELQRLETEYQLQRSILISLANEFNGNKIKLNKDTPIFSVLDEVSVPIQRSKPKRSQIVLMYTFLGLILSIGYIFLKDPAHTLYKKIIKK